MISFAFKVAARAAELETNPLARIFSIGIAEVTKGKFSHVEIVLNATDLSHARCFSSREPAGTDFATIDLTDTSLWVIVPGQEVDQMQAQFWCLGRRDRRYNFAGIEGVLLRQPLTDPHDDFCSQCAFEFIQDVFGKWTYYADTCWIAPSGFGTDGKRFGLYELLTGSQKLPAL